MSIPSAAMASTAPITHIRRNVSLGISDDLLWQRVRDELEQQMGRATYVAAMLYGLRLAAAHLGIKDLPSSLPDEPRS
jgi:hypothetical protein